MVEVTAIKIPQGNNKTALENFAFAIKHSTWGYPDRLGAADNGEGVPEGRIVLFGFDYECNVQKPTVLNDQRKLDPDEYRNGVMHKIYVAIATADTQDAVSPLWDDEVQAGEVKYVHRFPIAILGEINDLKLDDFSRTDFSSKKPRLKANQEMGLAAAFQFSALANAQPKKATLTDDEAANLADLLGRSSWQELIEDFSTSTSSPDSVLEQIEKDTSSGSSSAGYQMDVKKRKVIEQYAVDTAIGYYTKMGWDVKELGKPYDLDCTKEDGSGLRVEVKGTTGRAGEVILTINEVNSARNFETDLFVVSNIVVKPDGDDYQASGGTASLIEKWSPDDSDLSPQQYRYAIPWKSEKTQSVASD